MPHSIALSLSPHMFAECFPNGTMKLFTCDAIGCFSLKRAADAIWGERNQVGVFGHRVDHHHSSLVDAAEFVERGYVKVAENDP